ncbi:unnamed protein product [Pleuronectes platessa]|uniref:Uncharacterized protein n=1 Tax=Pleuronectes platessa TaxID=8262 RepID=A0A9N7YKG5_PLEPL|nr:unnamed protein product [Pleuronectes platessa]
MHVYGCSIPQRAVSDRAPLAVLTSTCQTIEPEADGDNAPVNRRGLSDPMCTRCLTICERRACSVKSCRSQRCDLTPAPDRHPLGTEDQRQDASAGMTAPAGRGMNEARLTFSPRQTGL